MVMRRNHLRVRVNNLIRGKAVCIDNMQIEFDDGTLLLRDAPDGVPHAEWDDRVDEYRAQARQYRSLRDWAGEWDDPTTENGQLELHQSAGLDIDLTDEARAYPDFALTPAVQIESRDYQQAALDAWCDHGRRGSVVLPTGSGKTFLAIQATQHAARGEKSPSSDPDTEPDTPSLAQQVYAYEVQDEDSDEIREYYPGRRYDWANEPESVSANDPV